MAYQTLAQSRIATPAQTRVAQRSVQLREVTVQAEWDALIARADFPHLPQSWSYGEGKRAKGWRPRRIAFSYDGRVVAVATILELRLLGLKLLNRINRGPLFVDGVADGLRVGAVYAAIRREWGRLGRGLLMIAPTVECSDESGQLLRQAGFRLRQAKSWQSGRIDLGGSEAELWAGFGSGFRNRCRQADKAGARLRIADDAASFEWLLERHHENMRAKKFNAVDATMLRAMRAAAPESVLVFQALDGETPVAGMSVVRFGGVCEYHIGWFGPAGRRLNAGNFLMWQIIREMKARGCTSFDVGGLKPGDGYTQFKKSMRPSEYALGGEWVAF